MRVISRIFAALDVFLLLACYVLNVAKRSI